MAKSTLSDEEVMELLRYLYERTVEEGIGGGFPREDATARAKQRLEKAIERSKETGWYNVGPWGRRMWRHLQEDQMKEKWQALEKEGVTKKDVLDWWNLLGLDRELTMTIHEDGLNEGMQMLVRKGMTRDEAGRLVCEKFVVFGDCPGQPVFPSIPKSVPLPFELRPRIDRWVASIEDWSEIQAIAASQYGTMNSLVRHYIAEGLI